MTTLNERLYTVLSPLATNGAWPWVNTISPPLYPYIAYHRIVSTTNNTLEGPSDVQNTRYQVDAISRDYLEAQAIATAIEAAMLAAPFSNVQISSRDLYDKDTKAYRCSSDYSCWSAD